MGDLTNFNMKDHGDSFEREWSPHVLHDFPSYETLWRSHIVPLSFRTWQPDNQFIRPSLPAHLVALADASYAVFYHVAHCHAYEHRLAFPKDPHDFPRPTELLYCFFTHAHSAHEALLHFCCAVNGVLDHHGREAAFEIEYGHLGKRFPQRLTDSRPCGANVGTVDVEEYQRLQSLLAAYRNLLIHEKPIFLQNMWLPRLRELGKYSGLTAIGQVARDPDAIRRDFRPVGEALVEVMALEKRVAEMVFAAALGHLDQLEGTRYDKERRVLGADRKLTREKFERIRER